MLYKKITEEIKKKLDIVDVISDYLPGLKKAGRNYKTNCPFHSERTPSFTVNREKQIFYCFGCGEGGDMFSFVMKMDNLTFLETVKKLAMKANIKINEEGLETLSPADREKIELKKALASAAHFYSTLLKSSSGAAALKYLKTRGFKDETIRIFGIGLAPETGNELINELSQKGFSDKILIKAGLAAIKENGRFSDYFRQRIVFPIRNLNGDITGFGGRIFNGGMPKYLNSPETPLFSKRRTLFGLHEGMSQIRKIKKVLFVEGYVDAAILHQFGINFAVSPLGTSLTQEHAATVKRYCDEAVILFDPDPAGINAAIKGADILVEGGIYPRIALLPSKLDPDEYLLKEGIESFYKIINAAADPVDFKISLILGKKHEIKPHEKSRIISYLAATLLKQKDEIIKMEWVKKISENFKINEVAILNYLSRNWKNQEEVKNQIERSKDAIPPVETGFIHSLIKEPALIAELEDFDPSFLKSDFAKDVFSELRSSEGSEGAYEILRIKFPQHAGLILKLSVEELDSDIKPLENLRQAAKMIKLSFKEDRWKKLKNRISALSAAEMEEFMKLSKEIKEKR